MRQEGTCRRRTTSLKWVGILLIVIAVVFCVTPRRDSVEPVVRIAFVDMSKLFNEYHRTKTVKAEFEATYNKKQEELEKRAAVAKELQKQLQEQASTLTEGQKRELEGKYKEELMKVREYRDDTAGQLKLEEQKAESQLLDELQKAVDAYATQRGYSLILRKSMLLYGAQNFDVTDDILKTVNAQ